MEKLVERQFHCSRYTAPSSQSVILGLKASLTLQYLTVVNLQLSENNVSNEERNS